jgi:hypothetical protein
MDGEGVYAVGETVKCSVIPPGAASMFAVSQLLQPAPFSPQEFLTNGLFTPFLVWRANENCAIITTWSTQNTTGGTTLTGQYSPIGATTYWQLEPFSTAAAHEFNIGTGTSTGAPPRFMPGPGTWGPAVDVPLVNVQCYEDIAADNIVCLDNTGAVISSFLNPDQTGSGAFGNGLGTKSAITDKCPGATVVVSSGTIGEGQVTRVSHFDTTGAVVCYNTWEVGQFSTFINGIDEFEGQGGGNCLAAMDNVTSTLLMLGKPAGIQDCQNTDSNAAVLWVNGSQGASGSKEVPVIINGSMSTAITEVQPQGSSNRKYVLHMNSGTPNAGTLAPLLDLGSACFQFLSSAGGNPVVVANNIGKTNAVGASSYFGSPTADPAKAPTFIDSLTQVPVDGGNFASGTKWTEQAIVINPAGASSTNGASLTNAVVPSIN